MAEVRYANLHLSPPAQRVVTIGSQPGPPLGEGWSQIATLPADSMQDASGQFAVIVSGKIGDVLLAGSPPSSGVIQVCLGTSNGLRHPGFRVSHTLTQPLAADEGVPFQFLLLISSALPDAVLGSSFTPVAGSNELCLWARTFRGSDPANYYCEFTVADVSWLWFDVGAIPASDWTLYEVGSSFTLPTAAPSSFSAGTALGPALGDVGERWLHFQNVWYEPGTPAAPAPVFRFVFTQDGTWPNVRTPIGSLGRWGQNRAPAVPQVAEIPQMQQGGFWSDVLDTNTTRVGFAAWEDAQATTRTQVHRYRHFAVRVDTLTDVHALWLQGPVSGGLRASDPAWSTAYQTIERPQPSPGLLTEPIVMLHQVAKVENQPAAYGCRVTEAEAPSRRVTETIFPRSDQTKGEAVSSMVFARRQFQRLSLAMQWRLHLVGSEASPAALQQLADLHFLAFHPVRDPENVSTPPGTKPAPIVVSPGRQSADVGSLAAPPTLPNADPLERGEVGRAAIEGATGYRPSWPVGSKPVRLLRLTWGPLDELAAAAVFAFLRSNRVWRYDEPRGDALAVMSMSNPTMDPTTHRSFTVGVDVAVLVWTGGA